MCLSQICENISPRKFLLIQYNIHIYLIIEFDSIFYQQVQDYLSRAEELKSLMKPKKMPQARYHPSISGKSPTNKNSANSSSPGANSSSPGANSMKTSPPQSPGANSSTKSPPQSPGAINSSTKSPPQSPTYSSPSEAEAEVDLTKSIELGKNFEILPFVESAHSKRSCTAVLEIKW